MIRRLPLFLLGLTISGSVLAYPLPEYDSVKACERVRSYGPEYNRKICAQGYEDAKTIAKAEWPKVPARIQEKCAKASASSAPGGGSYLTLKTCLQGNGFAKD